MPIPIRPIWPTDRGDLLIQQTDDGSCTLLKSGTNDAFHSGCGAVSETRHVYLQNSGVAKRISRDTATNVLEVGLGTAMAMLMTLDLAGRFDCELRYTAVELDWLPVSVFENLRAEDWIEETDLIDAYIRFRSQFPTTVSTGVYQWQVDRRRSVNIHVADFEGWSFGLGVPIHAIYFDPFCPESSPELWTEERFRLLRRLVSDDALLTTYSCSRLVRDRLQSAGWVPKRVPGPSNGKREVLVAIPSSERE